LAHNAGNMQARFNLTYLALESDNPEQVGLQPLLFSTLPRSGTWYAYHVLEFIERSLSRKPAPYQPGQVAVLTLVLSNLNLLKAHLHAVYPDFSSVYDGPHAQRWRSRDRPRAGGP